MNQYGSIRRVFTARNQYENFIDPPNDYTVPVLLTDEQLANPVEYPDFNVQGNIAVRQVGVFSNFADGFVFKNTWESFDVEVRSALYEEGSIGGVFSSTLGSKVVTGSGFLTLSAGDIIEVGNNECFIIESVTDDANAVVNDYPIRTHLLADWRPLTAVGSSQSQILFSIRELNHFFDMDFIAYHTDYANPGTTPTHLLLSARMLNFSDVELMTKTIDTSYSGDWARFDVKLIVEFTGA